MGIIGGGMAGLVCALSLEKRGVKSTVFDTVGSFGYLLWFFELGLMWAVVVLYGSFGQWTRKYVFFYVKNAFFPY